VKTVPKEVGEAWFNYTFSLALRLGVIGGGFDKAHFFQNDVAVVGPFTVGAGDL